MKKKLKISLLIGVISTVLIGAYLFASSYIIYQPIPFNEQAMSRAVKWVLVNGDASRDEGAVLLPSGLASVSATGKAYITNGIIFFPSLVGRQTLIPGPFNSNEDWIEGYGFSTTPLPTEASEPSGSDNFFCIMDLSDPAHTPDNGYGGREMAVENHIKKQWYKISSFS